jgi:hypothetical protein
VALVAAAVVSGEPGDVVKRLADSNGPPVFPAGALAITSAAIAAMAHYLTLPFRRFGRALIVAQTVGAFPRPTHRFGVITSVGISLRAGTAMHPVRGSPGGFPTVTWVTVALEDLGVEVEIRIYGRSAWEGELPGTAGRCSRQPISAPPTTRRDAS